MSAPQTPGQTAYAAWWQTRFWLQQADAATAYALLPPHDRRAWEAAAQAVRDAQEPRGACILTRAELEHLLNCLANQKFLHEMAEPRKSETQALIDMAWRKGMDWLTLGPQEERRGQSHS